MYDYKIKDRAFFQSKNWLEYDRERIIFTNGCFDILHPAHVNLLGFCKDLNGDVIVGVNSDESVQRLKGKGRPIIPESDRVFMIAALECVDFVIVFEEDTPYELIKLIKPDTIVKGGDWTDKYVVGTDIVEERKGTVEFFPTQKGYSTTSIIQKIKELEL